MDRTYLKAACVVTMVLLIAFGIVACCMKSASFDRFKKDVKSDLSGGLSRTVTVYTADGKVLKTYEGRIDLESTDGGIVKFDLNGQRIMYYNCYVEVIEKVN